MRAMPLYSKAPVENYASPLSKTYTGRRWRDVGKNSANRNIKALQQKEEVPKRSAR